MADPNDRVSGSIRTLALPPDEFRQPLLTRLFEYWKRLRGGERYVRYADLRPEEFAFALPYIALVERLPTEGQGLRIRLVGEEIRNEVVGYLKGRLIEEIEPAWYRDHLAERYRTVFAAGEPSLEAVHVVYDIRDYYYHRLILPLSSDGAAVDMIMVATVYTPPHPFFASPGDHLG